MIKKSLVLWFIVLPALLLGITAGFYGVRFTAAFEGPPGTAGIGSGAISADSSNNLAIGTTTVLSDTRLFILGSTSADDKFAIQLKNKEGRPLFVLRNDGRVVMGPFPVGNPPTFTTSTLLVRGLIETVNSISPNLGGGVRFPDGTTQTTAGASTASAANVSSGAFGANTGGGNYSFPASLSVGTTTVPTGSKFYAYGTNNADLVIKPSASPAVSVGGSANALVFTNTGTGAGAFHMGFELPANDANDGFFISTDSNTDGTVDKVAFRVIANGNIGIGRPNPVSRLNVSGGAADWDEATPGLNPGTIHLDPDDTTANFGNAITFGASDVYDGEKAEAGIYVRSDGTYGTKMYFATTDGYVAGSKTRLMIDNNGLITVYNRITGVSTPTGSSDAATKGYVDSVVGSQYMGRTVTTYTGNLGGIAGANAKCGAAYSGSHACTQSEMLRSGATTFGGNGWIMCDLVNAEETCLGVTYSYTANAYDGGATCKQWTWGTSDSYSGPISASTGNVTMSTCNISQAIHCCK